MNKSRLMALVELLETNEQVRTHFFMGTWSSRCGTAACAYGWYCRLGPEDRTSKMYLGTPELTYTPSSDNHAVVRSPLGLSAAKFEFDLPYELVSFIFLASSYDRYGVNGHTWLEKKISPDRVAKRIRMLINDHSIDEIKEKTSL